MLSKPLRGLSDQFTVGLCAITEATRSASTNTAGDSGEFLGSSSVCRGDGEYKVVVITAGDRYGATGKGGVTGSTGGDRFGFCQDGGGGGVTAEDAAVVLIVLIKSRIVAAGTEE